MKESYVTIKNGEVFVVGMHVSPYKEGNIFNVDPLRERKLLLNKREILRLNQEVQLKGMTLVPISLYEKNGRVKMELAVARGKKLYDKRESIKEKDIKRNLERYF